MSLYLVGYSLVGLTNESTSASFSLFVVITSVAIMELGMLLPIYTLCTLITYVLNSVLYAFRT